MSRFPLLALAALVASAQLIGCGGGSSSSSPPTAAPHTSAPVTAATGGTVSLSGGAAVQIPAGALGADTTITIQQSTDPAPTGAVGAVYDLGPSGTTFSQPVTVTLPVPAGTTDAVIWTKPAGAAHYTSLPTTVSGGVATAQATHFSVFLVGSVDLTGTWAGPMSYAVTNPDGSSAGISTQMQSRDVVQDVGSVTIDLRNATGFTARCVGTVNGKYLDTSCTASNLPGTCTVQYTQTGSVDGDSWLNASTLTWPSACAGQTYTAQSSPLTRQPGPARNIAGTYARTNTWTETGPGKQPVSGTGSGTVVRTQAAGSSLVDMTISMAGGATHTCKGIVVGDVSYGACYGQNGTIHYNTTGEATITPGSPLVLDGETATSIYNDPGGYTASTGTYHDVRQ